MDAGDWLRNGGWLARGVVMVVVMVVMVVMAVNGCGGTMYIRSEVYLEPVYMGVTCIPS